MTTLAWTYAAYLAVSGFITVYVADTLRKHGRVFVIDCFAGDERLADTANHLLVVGFYLTNIAFVLLTLKSGLHGGGWLEAAELLSRKVGLILCVLGGMHFFNLLVLSAIRKSARRRREKKTLALTRETR